MDSIYDQLPRRDSFECPQDGERWRFLQHRHVIVLTLQTDDAHAGETRQHPPSYEPRLTAEATATDKEVDFTIGFAPARLPLQLSTATSASAASSLVRSPAGGARGPTSHDRKTCIRYKCSWWSKSGYQWSPDYRE